MEGRFTSKRVQTISGINHVSVRTIRRVMERNGYAYRQARRKGLLCKKDLTRRVAFAKNVIKHYSESIWTEDICFYFDGKSFIHKLHPADPGCGGEKMKAWPEIVALKAVRVVMVVKLCTSLLRYLMAKE